MLGKNEVEREEGRRGDIDYIDLRHYYLVEISFYFKTGVFRSSVSLIDQYKNIISYFYSKVNSLLFKH